MQFVGVDELHAAFLDESRTRGCCLVPRTGNLGISLVFREMWDSTDVDRSVHRMNRKSEGKSSHIPHLAKNERDMGHPSVVREREADPSVLKQTLLVPALLLSQVSVIPHSALAHPLCL